MNKISTYILTGLVLISLFGIKINHSNAHKIGSIVSQNNLNNIINFDTSRIKKSVCYVPDFYIDTNCNAAVLFDTLYRAKTHDNCLIVYFSNSVYVNGNETKLDVEQCKKKYKPLLDSLGLEFLYPIFPYIRPDPHFVQSYTIETVYDSITKKVIYRTPPPPKKEIKPPFEGGFVVIKKEGVFTSNPICIELDALRKSKSVSKAYQVIIADNKIGQMSNSMNLDGEIQIKFFGLRNGGVSPADAKKIAAEYGLKIGYSYTYNDKINDKNVFDRYDENGSYDYMHIYCQTPAWLYDHTFNQINKLSKLQSICSIKMFALEWGFHSH